MISIEAINERMLSLRKQLIDPKSNGFLPNAQRDTGVLIGRHTNQLRFLGYESLLKSTSSLPPEPEADNPFIQETIDLVIWLENQPAVIMGHDYFVFSETLLLKHDDENPAEVRRGFFPI